MSNEITRLSLTQLETEPGEFRRQLYLGLREYGFIILRDHPISKAKLDDAYLLARSSCSPCRRKPSCATTAARARPGDYTAFGRENAVGNVHADLKEFWHIGPDVAADSPYHGYYPDNVWPQEIPGFETTFRDLYQELEQLGKHLLAELGGNGAGARFLR